MSVTRVILPKLGLTMDEGTLVSWLKREGERVEAGEVLFEVETDKSIMEVEAPAPGYVRSLLVEAGATVPVARVVALISTTEDEPLGPVPQASPFPPASDADGEAAATLVPEAARAESASPPGGDERGRIVASPAARKRAQELGIDLAGVTPSKGARISIEDVEAAASAPAAAGPQPSATGAAPVPLSRMRRAIAAAMTVSGRDVPQFSVSRDVDMTAANETRRKAGVSYMDVLVFATARALRAHPGLAMRYEGDALVPAAGIHLGLAVAVDGGLLVPVLRDADRKDLAAIDRERHELQDAARAGRLAADATSGAVLTISNLGQHGIDRFTALVNPPEAAILAVGRVADRPFVRDGALVVAPVLTLTLSVDHRVADGAQAAAFLVDLAESLEQGLAATATVEGARA